MSAPRLLVGGDARHGVVKAARVLADAVARAAPGVRFEHGDPRGDVDLGPGGRLHVHVTDRVWGASPEDAAARLERLLGTVPTTVTFHDLPQGSDGPRLQPRRASCYARVARAAAGVACHSQHEARLLAAVSDVAPAVIPLPVDPRPAPATRPATADDVAVLGFFYPGKGHDEVLDAAAQLGGPGVSVLGAAAPGHDHDLARFGRRAARLGVPLDVTGWLGEEEQLARCRGAGVPVAAHRHLSASGSIVSWVAAGRRPLVPASRVTRELAALRPGTLTLYPAGALPAAIDRARRVPDSTWWAPTATTRPGGEDVARAYLAWWAGGVAW